MVRDGSISLKLRIHLLWLRRGGGSADNSQIMIQLMTACGSTTKDYFLNVSAF